MTLVRRIRSAIFASAFLLPAGPGPAPAADGPASRPARAGVDPKDKPAVRRLFDSWKLPVPPRRLIGNIYYVGAAGVSAFLVTTPDGHFLLDTGFDDMSPAVQKNVADLGFKVGDIRYVLSSHAHADHTGGHAPMKRASGAAVVASAADARVLESGGADDFSPFPKEFMAYTPVKVDRIVKDGDAVTLGGVTLTAHLTPGHTKGATTWTMDVTADGRQYAVAFFSNTTLVEGTKLVGNADYPNIVEDYRATIATLKTLQCDVFLAPHGGAFAMSDKFARLAKGETPNPFIDPAGWRRAVAAAEREFERQLAAEQRPGDGRP